MTKRNSTKRALLLSALSLLMCVSMLIGSTFAWFTDSVTSAGNKIQAGTLKIDLELLDKQTGWKSIKDSKAAIFDYDKWEPGYTDVKILKVENKGDLALKWIAKFVSATKLSALADVIDVYVKPSANEFGYTTDRTDLSDWKCVGTVAEFVNTISETTNGTLKAGEKAFLGIALKMQESAGNEYQSLDLGGAFDIQILAIQQSYETDSFGSEYDENLKPDALYVSTPNELIDAFNNEDAYIVLQDDIVLADPVTVNKPITLDLNEKTLTVTALNIAKNATINNGTIASGANAVMAPQFVFSGDQLEMNDVTVDGKHYLNATTNWSEAVGMSIQNATAVLNNCDIKINNQEKANWVFAYAIDLWNTELTVNGGSITAICVDGYAPPSKVPTNPIAISSYGNCTATLKNVEVDAPFYGSAIAGCLTINTTDRNVKPTAFANNNGGRYALNFID